MADLSQILVGFLDALARNPFYMFLFILFIALLIVLLLVHHIRVIHRIEIWVHGRDDRSKDRQ